MPITFGTSNGVQMQLISNADTLTGWSGSHDGLETFGYAIQGADCVVVAIRKGETISNISVANTVSNVPAGSQVIFNLASSVAQLATSQTLTINGGGGSSSVYSFREIVNGYFQALAFDCDTGTTSFPGTFNSISFNFSQSSSNISTSNNIWLDASYIGNGVDLTGATASDKLFREGWIYDTTTADIYNGVLTEREGIIFCQSNLFISTTTGNSFNETLVFYETVSGNNVYTLEGNGTADFENTNITTSGAAILNIDFTNMASLSISGGSFTGYNTLDSASGQSMSGIVFQSGNLTNVANALTNSTFNQCNTITVTGSLSYSTINSSTVSANTAAVIVDDSDKLVNNSFIRGANGHAVELTAAVDANWDCKLTGYATGTTSPDASTPVTTTNNGNEAIYVSATTGTFTLSVSNTATVPSIRSAGANVIVLSGQKTLTITDLPPGVEVRIKQGTFTLKHIQDITGTTFTYSYTTPIKVTITAGGTATDGTTYERRTLSNYLLPSTSADLPFELTPTNSYE
jgi:hypothetical protein